MASHRTRLGGGSSLADAVVFCSSGVGDLDRHDTEIICFLTGGSEDFLRTIINIDTSRFFDDPPKRVANDAENLLLLANPVLPHSRGEIVITAPIRGRSRRSG